MYLISAVPCNEPLPTLRNGSWLPLNGTCFHFKCRHIFECDRSRGFTSQRVIETTCGDTGVWTKPDGACEGCVSLSFIFKNNSYLKQICMPIVITIVYFNVFKGDAIYRIQYVLTTHFFETLYLC